MSGIAVISNPRSGQNRRNPQLLRRLAYVLGDNGELAQPPDLDHLEETVQSLRQRQIEIVCVSGGDGTLHKVLSSLVRVYGEGRQGPELRDVRLPRIAILRSGTVNTISRNIGLKMQAHEFLGTVVSSYHGSQPLRIVERNVLVVNGGESSGFLFGTGVLSRFMEAYYAGGTTGPWKAVKVLSRAIWSAIVGGRFAKELFRRDLLDVRVDGNAWQAPEGYAAIAAGTTNDLGLGFKVFHAAKDHPDHLQVLGFPCGPESVIKALHRVYLGRPMNRPDIYDAVARRFTIRSQGSLSYMIDGDFVRCEQQSLQVETGPRVRFLVP